MAENDEGRPGRAADVSTGIATVPIIADNTAISTTSNAAVHSSDIGPPRRGPLFATRYVDRHGRTWSKLFRRRSAAERYAAHVEARGGTATIWQSRIGPWSS